MPRCKKKPDYEPQKIQEELIDAIVTSYNNPKNEECSDKDKNHKQLKLVAEEFGITPLKVRKLLITGGAFETETSRLVQRYYAQGLSISQIGERMNLGRASVHSYLPYSKVIYKAKEISTDAERIQLFRERNEAVRQLQNEMSLRNVWNAIVAFEGYPFFTVKKLKFRYTVRGMEIFIDRKEKSITKSTIEIALQKAVEMNKSVTGPKKLGVFGASYIYPIFVRFGIIESEMIKKHQN